MSVSEHMQVLTTLNKFGETSNATVKACIVCFGGDGRDMMWKPHCCGQSTHFDCAETQMLKFGTAVCFSCEMPLHDKKPNDAYKNIRKWRRAKKTGKRHYNKQIESPWTWVAVDWATPAFDNWSEMDDISWTWARVLDGCFIPHAKE